MLLILRLQSENSLELVLNMTAVTFIAKLDDKKGDAGKDVMCLYAIHKELCAVELGRRARARAAEADAAAGDDTLGFGFQGNAYSV